MRRNKNRILAVAMVIQVLLSLIAPASAFAQQGDPPPLHITDKTEVLDSQTEKVPNSLTADGGTCDKITRRIKVTPVKGEPMLLTEMITLCPNLKLAQKPLSDARVTPNSGTSSMVQYAPAPSYTCAVGQQMRSRWTISPSATVWLYYSYYDPNTGTYGTYGTSLNGTVVGAGVIDYTMTNGSQKRFYAARLDTSPAAIQSGNGTWCFF